MGDEMYQPNGTALVACCRLNYIDYIVLDWEEGAWLALQQKQQRIVEISNKNYFLRT